MASTEQRKIQIIADGNKVNSSLQEMQASSRLLYNQLRKLPQGSDEFVKKSADLKKVNDRMGGIKKEIGGTTDAMAGLKAQTAQYIPFGPQIAQMGSLFGVLTKSINSGSKAAKFFKIALASTGVGLIALALGALISYLTSTQEGMDKVTAVTRPLSVIFQRLLGVLQTLGKSGFDGLAKAVENPKQAFLDFVNFIKNNIINRVKSLGVAFGGLQKIISGDFKGGFKDLGNAAIQGLSGVENGIEKIGKAVNKTSDFFKESVAQGTQLDLLTKKIEQSEIDLTTARANLNEEYQKGKEAAQDLSRTDKERLEGAQAAQDAQNKLLSLEKDFIDQKIDRMKLEQTFNDTSREGYKELATLEAERTTFEATAAKKRASAKSLENTVSREIAAEQIGRQKEEVAAEKAKQDELTKLREAYSKSIAETNNAVRELKIAAIADETERELAEIDYKHEQEIAKIDEQREALLVNDAITHQERQAQLAMLDQEQNLLEDGKAAEKKAIKDANRQEEQAKELENLDEQKQLELAKLENHFLNVNAKEQEEFEARLNLQRQFAADKLALLQAQGKGETLEAINLKNKILEIDQDLNTGKKENSKALEQFNKVMQSNEISIAQNGLQVAADLLSMDEDMRKEHARKIKAIQIANVIIDGIKEIAGIWRTYNSSPMNVLIPGSGAILAAAQSAISIGRTIGAVSKIKSQKFGEGGGTGKGKMIDMMYNASTGQYSYSGGSAKNVGSFAKGGNINSASTGLIGEAGAEWVAPNWMMKSPAYANTIGWLEGERQRGTRAFAAGGGTAAMPTPQLPAAARSPSAGIADMQKDFREMKDAIINFPKQLRVINVVSDTIDGINTLNEIEEDSKITRSA